MPARSREWTPRAEPATAGSVEEERPSPGEITRLLDAWSDGDPEALDRLMPLVYDQLRRIAARCFRREIPNHTLQPTALVHEAYFKLKDQRRVRWHGQREFYAVAAGKIRQILIDHARKRLAQKRGGAVIKIPLDETLGLGDGQNPGLIALDDALRDLARLSPRQGRVLELRIFGGFKLEDIAELEDIGRSTVVRDWNAAVRWLRRELKAK